MSAKLDRFTDGRGLRLGCDDNATCPDHLCRFEMNSNGFYFCPQCRAEERAERDDAEGEGGL